MSNALNHVGSSQELLYVTAKVFLPTNKNPLHLKENIQHSLNCWSLQQSTELTFFLESTKVLLSQLLQSFLLRSTELTFFLESTKVLLNQLLQSFLLRNRL
jgi:hypothetical protein